MNVKVQDVANSYNITSAKDYISALKPRVMSLSIFTAIVGVYVAPSSATLNPAIILSIIVCIALGAGAAGALNMWYDADVDKLMKRTRKRPVAALRMPEGEAKALGIVLAVLSTATLSLFTNVLAGFLLAFTIFFYAVIYTIWLKRSTPQNIVIGGVAGALPPLIGYVAVQNSIDSAPIIMFLIIFFWTPPHFWALSLFCEMDYKAAGIPMLNITNGREATKKQIIVYSIILALVTLLPYVYGIAGLFYASFAFFLGVAYVAVSFYLYAQDERKKETYVAKKMFWFSILHLFVIFVLLLIGW